MHQWERVVPWHQARAIPTSPSVSRVCACSAGGAVCLYSDPHRPGGGAAAVALSPAADASPRRCLSLAAMEPTVAAGSSRGGVAVWDVASLRLREEYPELHGHAAVHALAFVPLRPGWLYSAGDDGRVCLQVGAHAGTPLLLLPHRRCMRLCMLPAAPLPLPHIGELPCIPCPPPSAGPAVGPRLCVCLLCGGPRHGSDGEGGPLASGSGHCG